MKNIAWPLRNKIRVFKKLLKYDHDVCRFVAIFIWTPYWENSGHSVEAAFYIIFSSRRRIKRGVQIISSRAMIGTHANCNVPLSYLQLRVCFDIFRVFHVALHMQSNVYAYRASFVKYICINVIYHQRFKVSLPYLEKIRYLFHISWNHFPYPISVFHMF